MLFAGKWQMAFLKLWIMTLVTNEYVIFYISNKTKFLIANYVFACKKELVLTLLFQQNDNVCKTVTLWRWNSPPSYFYYFLQQLSKSQGTYLYFFLKKHLCLLLNKGYVWLSWNCQACFLLQDIVYKTTCLRGSLATKVTSLSLKYPA